MQTLWTKGVQWKDEMRELVNSCVCPFEGGFPLLGGSIKRGSTVIRKCM